MLLHYFNYSQNLEFVVFNTNNSAIHDNVIISLAIDSSNNKWIGGFRSNVNKFNNKDWFYYGFYHYARDIYDIKVDKNNNIWLSFGEGLAEFDSSEWIQYTSKNSGLPYDRIFSISVDLNNIVWLGLGDNMIVKFNKDSCKIFRNDNLFIFQETKVIEFDKNNNVWVGYYDAWSEDEGLGIVSKFDGINWFNFTPNNSGLPSSMHIHDLKIDSKNNKWIGTLFGGFAKFDDSLWTIYNTSNSGLPNNSIDAIAIDDHDVKWVGTRGGLAKFDDTSWTVWNTDNSDIPSNRINCIVIDKYGNKWIGTDNGLAVFREGGVVGVEEPKETKGISIKCYPNPAEDKVKFSFHSTMNSEVKLSLTNCMGAVVREIILDAGTLQSEAELDVSDLPCGLYFATVRSGGQVQTEKFVVLR